MTMGDTLRVGGGGSGRDPPLRALLTDSPEDSVRCTSWSRRRTFQAAAIRRSTGTVRWVSAPGYSVRL